MSRVSRGSTPIFDELLAEFRDGWRPVYGSDPESEANPEFVDEFEEVTE
jgi:hypothetical protein